MNQPVLNVRTVNNTALGSMNDVAGTPTVIGLLKQTYNALSSNTGDSNHNLTALQNRINSLENTVNGSEETNPPIEGLTARVSDLEDVTDDQTINISLNADNISDLSQQLSTLNTTVQGIHTTVQGIRSGVGESTNNLGGERFNLYSNGNPVRNDASGDYSHAEGYLTIASGNYSHVEGSSTKASGESSHAEGSMTKASGQYAHSEGYTANTDIYAASGQGSHTEGINTSATNTACHAEGGFTSATGLYAHSEGFHTTASGHYSHSGGSYTIANSENMVSIGKFNTNDGNNSSSRNRLLVVGNGDGTSSDNANRSDAFVVKYDGSIIINSTRSGTTPSLTIGPSSKAITGTTALSSSTNTGDDIIATKYYVDDSKVGEKTNNTGGERFNDYINNTANGEYAHVEGSGCNALAQNSHSEGSACSSFGRYSHSEGNLTKAGYTNPAQTLFYGSASHSEGYGTQAKGDYSHSGGEYTIANSKAMTAVGRYNIDDGTDYNVVNNLFVVGNGTSSTDRSNAFVVKNNEVIIPTPLTINTSKSIVNTTASNTSTNTGDDILATKYYVDNRIDPFNTSTNFVYYGSGTITFYIENGNNNQTVVLSCNMLIGYIETSFPNIFVRIPYLDYSVSLSGIPNILNVQFTLNNTTYRLAKNFYPEDTRVYCGSFKSVGFANNDFAYIKEGFLSVINNSTPEPSSYDYKISFWSIKDTSYVTTSSTLGELSDVNLTNRIGWSKETFPTRTFLTIECFFDSIVIRT